MKSINELAVIFLGIITIFSVGYIAYSMDASHKQVAIDPNTFQLQRIADYLQTISENHEIKISRRREYVPGDMIGSFVILPNICASISPEVK